VFVLGARRKKRSGKDYREVDEAQLLVDRLRWRLCGLVWLFGLGSSLALRNIQR